MISLMAKLKCLSLWEFLLIPSFIYFFQKLYPFSKVNNNKEKLAAAAGGFILCKSSIFKKENIYDIILVLNYNMNGGKPKKLYKIRGNMENGFKDCI